MGADSNQLIFSENKGECDLHSFGAVLVDEATKVKHTTAISRSNVRRCLQILIEAERKRSAATTSEERKQWRTIAQRERRKWKAQLALSKASSKQVRNKVPNLLRCQGQLTHNRNLWTRQVLETCETKYFSTENSTDDFVKVREHLQGLSGDTHTTWDMRVTLSARARLKTKTASGGGSDIVPEMLLALSWLQIEVVNDMF